MARSVVTPLRIAGTGGTRWTPATDGGQRSLEQVIVSRLTPGTTLHPFDLAAGLTVAGGLYTPAGRRQTGEIEESVRRAFADLEASRRARLVEIDVRPAGNDGRRTVNVVWQNLELGGQPARFQVEV